MWVNFEEFLFTIIFAIIAFFILDLISIISNAQYYDSFHDYFNKNKENLREHMKNYLACVPLLIYFLAIAYMIL